MTSLVITVFNEESSLPELLDSLDQQTKKAEEIIFIDAGSQDKTFSILKDWAITKQAVRIFCKKGLTIAQGRNLGIKKAQGNIIVHTDAGCRLQKNWFLEITRPFENPQIDVVAGFYKMTGQSVFQKCLAPYLGILPQRVDPQKFLPSARSMAFRKKVWQKIGGFSEKLTRAGEDTLFNYWAQKLDFNFFFASRAIVYWQLPQNPLRAFKKFFVYAFGDVQVDLWWHPGQKISTHNLKIVSLYLRWLLITTAAFWSPIISLFLLIIYLTWIISKNRQLTIFPAAYFWLPLIQFLADLAVMTGFAAAKLSALINKR